MQNNYDVAIIGGGLAGLASSILLAKGGLKVILFEQHFYPYHKVCGEYISLESWDFLEQLGLQLSELDLPIIKKFRLSHQNGKSLNVDLPLGGFGISRYSLDDMLCELALQAGVIVLQGNKVENVEYIEKEDLHHITTEYGIIVSTLAIGSFGKRSLLDKKLNRKFIQKPKSAENNFVAIKYHINSNLSSDTVELHLFNDGYCGISKVDKDRYCFCYLTKASNLKNHKGNIAKMEREVLSQNPYLAKYFENFDSLYDEPLTISQIEFGDKEIIVDHILMAGDSAGLTSPLSGNGMSMALLTAKLLNEHISNYFKNGKKRELLEKEYLKSWNSNFKQRVNISRKIQHLFYNESLSATAISILKNFPSVSKKIISLTQGKKF